jgi:protein-L-isoaspartate O-methyltransferase
VGARPEIDVPIGLHVKDPWIRAREQAVRRLLHDGVLRTADLVEAMLQVGPEAFMAEEDARAVLGERRYDERPEGELWPSLELRVIAIGLEALEPAPGDRVALLCERSGYLAAVLSPLVGEEGRVLVMRHDEPEDMPDDAWERLLAPGNVELREADPARPLRLEGTWDGVWISAAIPRVPTWVSDRVDESDGRVIAFVGPRFRPQDLVSVTRHGKELVERRVARLRIPVLAGAGGWLRAPVTGTARAAE